MQLMGQSAQQKAVTKIGALEASMGEMQRKQKETDANLLKIIDTIQLQQEAVNVVIERVEALTEKVLAVETQAKRKPGRPRGSKNKPKATGAPEAVPQETAPAPGKASE